MYYRYGTHLNWLKKWKFLVLHLNIHTEGVGVTLDVYLQWIKQFFQNGVGHHWISEFHATESLSSNVLP